MSARSSQKKFNPYLYFIASVAGLCGLLFGFNTAVISGAMLFLKSDFALTPQNIEVIVSAVLFGAVIGCCFGKFTDQFGRRTILVIITLIFSISSLVCAMTPNVAGLIVGRVTIGIAIGIASYTAPLYLAEISPTQSRGFLVSFNQLGITLGILAAYATNYLFSDTGDWRMMLGLGMIPALLLFVGMVFLPESPRWMVVRGLHGGARAILKKIRNSEDIDQELNEIKEALAYKQSGLFSKNVIRVLLLAGLLMVFSQIDGINTLIYYAPTVFNLSGFKQNTIAILATLGIGVVNVLFTLITMPLLDRVGRKPLLFIGVGCMTLSLFTLGLIFSISTFHSTFESLSLFSILLYVAGFAIGLGPVSWLIAAEVIPLHLRGSGIALVTACNWMSNMFVSFLFLTSLQSFGIHLFWLFSGLCIVTIFFIYRYIPETKGTSLEKIEINLQNGVKLRDIGNAHELTK